MYGDHLYQVHPDLPSLKGLRVERPGRYLGQAKRSHFVPSHALALSSLPEQVKQTCDFQADDPDLLLYLQGEALPSDLAKGWTLVTVDGYPLGWGKVSGRLLKKPLSQMVTLGSHIEIKKRREISPVFFYFLIINPLLSHIGYGR